MYYRVGWPFWRLMVRLGIKLHIRGIAYTECKSKRLVAECFETGIKVYGDNTLRLCADFSFAFKKYLWEKIGTDNLSNHRIEVVIS